MGTNVCVNIVMVTVLYNTAEIEQSQLINTLQETVMSE
jgi:hypothetical protein